MRILLIFLILALNHVLPAFSQNTAADSIYGLEGKDYAPGIVVIIFDKSEFSLFDFLKKVEKNDPRLKQDNALLADLGIDYPLIGFTKHSNLVMVKVKDRQTVVEAIAKIKATCKVKISRISPYYVVKTETAR